MTQNIQNLKSVLHPSLNIPGTLSSADKLEIMRTYEFLVVQMCVYKSRMQPQINVLGSFAPLPPDKNTKNLHRSGVAGVAVCHKFVEIQIVFLMVTKSLYSHASLLWYVASLQRDCFPHQLAISFTFFTCFCQILRFAYRCLSPGVILRYLSF